MSATLVILPSVWAAKSKRLSAKAKPRKQPKTVLVQPEWAFYRKHTEGMLRRYMRFSLEAGRVPSMLGKEMFRGKVTSYRMESFDDLLIFVHDVDKCMKRVTPLQKLLLTRIAVQEYTYDEMAEMLGAKRWTVIRRYEEALDCLTAIFVEVKLMETFQICQEGKIAKSAVSISLEGEYLVA